jgi:hypothetical protein
MKATIKLSALPANRVIYVCVHVFDSFRDMNYVHYDYDGDLLVTCSGSDHDFTDADAVRVVGLGHLIDRDVTLLRVPELRLGARAERSERDRPWQVFDNGQ